MLEDKEINRIASLLVSQDSLIPDQKRTEVYDRLGISSNTYNNWNRRYQNGDLQQYELNRLMMLQWRSSKTAQEATLTILIQIFRALDLHLAADLLDYKKKTSTTIFGSSSSFSSSFSESSSPSTWTTWSLMSRNLQMGKFLDQGYFTEIYKAKGIFDGGDYAIKRISVGKFIKSIDKISDGGIESGGRSGTQHFDKLLREVRAMAKCKKSPNIVAYYDAWFEGPREKDFQSLLFNNGEIGSGPWERDKREKLVIHKPDIETYFCIKMEFCDANLDQWMDANPPQTRSLQKSEDVVIQILEGLTHIHSMEYIHRDIKPQNILINRVNDKVVVKIGDFGLAREYVGTGTQYSTNLKVLNREFQSPEMYRGDIYDQKTDIFSVGLIYLSLLYDFGGDNKSAIRMFDNLRNNEEKEKTSLFDVLGKMFDNNFLLMKLMLERNSVKRPCAADALKKLAKK